MAGAPPWWLRLLELLLLALQALLDAFLRLDLWLRVAALGRRRRRRGDVRNQQKQRGSRPPAPRRVGLVFAEPERDDITIQCACNLLVW